MWIDIHDQVSGKSFEEIGYEKYSGLPPYREKYLSSALATVSQISCLMGLIASYRFSDGRAIERVLEVGVDVGVTDLYLLKTGMENPNFHLYSIEKWEDSFLGSAVYQEADDLELQRYSLHKGKTTFDIERILDPNLRLDMIFIDGAHAHPYPLIDLLFLLPYLHRESLIVLHDVEMYPVVGEQGNCYIFSAWDDKYINRKLLDGKISPNTEYMGILKLPESHKRLQEILLHIAGVPIDFPHYSYDAKEENLGLDLPAIDHDLRDFLMRHYDVAFAEQLANKLTHEFRTYKEHWTYRKHFSRIMNQMLQQVKSLDYRTKFLQSLLMCGMPHIQFGFHEGERYIVYGAGGRYQSAVDAIRSAGGDVVAIMDLDERLCGQSYQGIPIISKRYLLDGISYDGIVISSIDYMKQIYDSVMVMGIPQEKFRWTELS